MGIFVSTAYILGQNQMFNAKTQSVPISLPSVTQLKLCGVSFYSLYAWVAKLKAAILHKFDHF